MRLVAKVQHNRRSAQVVGYYHHPDAQTMQEIYLVDGEDARDVVYIGDYSTGAMMVHSADEAAVLDNTVWHVLDNTIWHPLYKGDTITIKL